MCLHHRVSRYYKWGPWGGFITALKGGYLFLAHYPKTKFKHFPNLSTVLVIYVTSFSIFHIWVTVNILPTEYDIDRSELETGNPSCLLFCFLLEGCCCCISYLDLNPGPPDKKQPPYHLCYLALYGVDLFCMVLLKSVIGLNTIKTFWDGKIYSSILIDTTSYHNHACCFHF